jgi:ribokinase
MATDDPPRVAVVGSYNHGLTMAVESIPRPGETVLGWDFAEGVGGKGSNQAIAAARLGADATFVGRVGDDRFAGPAFDLWDDEEVTALVERDPEAHTGVGIVVVDEAGENAIAVAPGANGRLDADDVRAHADAIADADVLLCQLETEDAPVLAAAELAAEHDTTFVLNPAPAREIHDDLLGLADVVTPNEAEARGLAGADESADPSTLAATLGARGAKTVLLTLGGDGALLVTDEGETTIEPASVDVVDTTGAGDAFNAGLAVALAEGRPLVEAARFACRAGAGACTGYEVVPALPTREELP